GFWRLASGYCFPRRRDGWIKTEDRFAVRRVERGSGCGRWEGRGGCSTCAQASQESEERKEREDRPRGDFRSAAEVGARAFVFRAGWAAAVAAFALAFGCRPDFQFD